MNRLVVVVVVVVNIDYVKCLKMVRFDIDNVEKM